MTSAEASYLALVLVVFFLFALALGHATIRQSRRGMTDNRHDIHGTPLSDRADRR